MSTADFRIEKDSMGEVRVPAKALYGAQTQRAVENFAISGFRFPREFIRALGEIKLAAAITNQELGLLDQKIASAIRLRLRKLSRASSTISSSLTCFKRDPAHPQT